MDNLLDDAMLVMHTNASVLYVLKPRSATNDTNSAIRHWKSTAQLPLIATARSQPLSSPPMRKCTPTHNYLPMLGLMQPSGKAEQSRARYTHPSRRYTRLHPSRHHTHIPPGTRPPVTPTSLSVWHSRQQPLPPTVRSLSGWALRLRLTSLHMHTWP